MVLYISTFKIVTEIYKFSKQHYFLRDFSIHNVHEYLQRTTCRIFSLTKRIGLQALYANSDM